MYQIRFILITLILAISKFVLGQTNPSELHFTIFQGEDITFTLQSDWQDPTISFAPTDGILEETSTGNQYEIVYTPNPDFIGQDVFSYKSIIMQGGFFFPSPELTVVYVDVIKSQVDANNDFVEITNSDAIEIFPLENDQSNTSSHELSKISHVMYGNAITTDSNSIIYIPAEKDLDYILYTIEDSLGTTSTATVYIKRTEPLESYIAEQFSISSSQTQYIFLESDQYSITIIPDLGNIEFVTDKVLLYTPDEFIEGTDAFSLETPDGDIAEFTIEIYNSYQDLGVVRDDQYFTSLGQEIVFNGFENDYDNSLIIDEENTSQELLYLGGGMFSYIPDPDFNGIKEFFYTADNGFTTEVGNIDIGVTNFNPVSTSTYEFETLEGTVLSLAYDIPLNGYYFEVASTPSFGTLGFFNEDLINTACGDIINSNVVIYTPFNEFQGDDEFDLLYCPDDEVNPCTLVKTKVTVNQNLEDECPCVDKCVWSGDANNDGIVDIRDVLTIGRSIGNVGEQRESPDDWSGEYVPDWDGENVYGINYKHADTDGNGNIAAEDVSKVLENYNQVHSYTANHVLAVKDYPFSMIPRSTDVEPGEKMIIDIFMGSAEYPVVDLSGVAFAINLNPDVVDSSSVKLTFLEDEYFVKQSPFLNVMHQPTDGILHVAGIKTNNSTSNGHGLIATLEFIVEDDVEGVKLPQKLRSSSNNSNILEVDIIIKDIVIEDGNGYQYSINPVSTDFKVELPSEEGDQLIEYNNFYPNPANTHISIGRSKSERTIIISDANARIVVSKNILANEGPSNAKLDVSSLKPGYYTVSIVTKDEIFTESLVIVR